MDLRSQFKIYGPIRVVPINDQYQTSSYTYVLNGYGSKTIDYSSRVPEGYKCVAMRNMIMTHVSGHVVACFESSDLTTVRFRNITSSTAYPTGRNGSAYYYKITGELLCVPEDDEF